VLPLLSIIPPIVPPSSVIIRENHDRPFSNRCTKTLVSAHNEAPKHRLLDPILSQLNPADSLITYFVTSMGRTAPRPQQHIRRTPYSRSDTETNGKISSEHKQMLFLCTQFVLNITAFWNPFLLTQGTCGSVVVDALCYKSEGRGFQTR
jgi:hypothetical protein